MSDHERHRTITPDYAAHAAVDMTRSVIDITDAHHHGPAAGTSSVSHRSLPRGAAAVLAVVAVCALVGCSSSGRSSAPDAHSATTPTVTAPTSVQPTTPGGTTSSAPGSTTGRPSTTGSPGSGQAAVLDTLPGSSGAGCVSVGNRTDVRSGPIGMGNFAQQRAAYRAAKGGAAGQPLFFYVIPTQLPGSTVSVTMTPVSAHGDSRTIHAGSAQQAGRWTYFPVSVTYPAPGTWRIVATAGSERGCFLVSFTS
jgi:hypothetical protein